MSPPRTPRRRIALHALGCRVNQAEIDCLRGQIRDRGHRIVPFDAEAEVYVLNTCTVTGAADADGRKLIRRALRRKPEGGLVVVTGCYAQRDPHALRSLQGVDLILGNAEKPELLDHLENHVRDRRLPGELQVSEIPGTRTFLSHGASEGPDRGRTRATLKIQDGCDEGCTYCIIPSVRGRSVSRPCREVLEQAVHLASLGYREIALTGVNAGAWGRDLGEPRGLALLVRRLQDLDLPVRFRLGSLEPATLTEDLLDAIEACPAFCRHFHVPLQHGDGAMLRLMGRGYGPELYRERILHIHERFPLGGLGADVMVGFPGETEARFEAGRNFLARLPLSYLHVFSYSPREGTPATRLPGHLPPGVRQARSLGLRELDRTLRLAFIERLRGRRELVLIEGRPGGRPGGLTGSFLRVEMDPLSGGGENEFWEVRIQGAVGPRLARARLTRRRPLA